MNNKIDKTGKYMELMSIVDDDEIKKKLTEQEYINIVNKLKEIKDENDKNTPIFAECEILKNEIGFDLDGNCEIKIVSNSKIYEFKNRKNLENVKRNIEKKGFWKNPLNKCKLAFPELLLEQSDTNPIYYNTSETIVKINEDVSRFSKTYRLCDCGNPEHSDESDESYESDENN